MARLNRLPSWERAFSFARQQKLRSLKEEIPEEVFRRGMDLCGSIEVYERLSRAMSFLREQLARGNLPNGTVVLARSLLAAKGRFSRTWLAPRGGLWLALALYDDFLPEVRGWLPITFGLAVVKALRSFGAGVFLRWVNDVHFGGDKVAGLLLEEVHLGGAEKWILVGLGVNVNNDLPPDLPARSLSEILGKRLSLSRVFGEISGEMVRFFGMLRVFEVSLLHDEPREEQPFGPWLHDLCDTPGKRVVFGEDLFQKPEGEGFALGFDAAGGLRVETKEGCFVLRSGEVRYL